MAAPGERPVKDFTLRAVQKPEEMRAVEEVERTAGQLLDEPPIPAPVQRAMQDNGGLVLGAFADIHLAGCAVGFLGWDGEALYHYSHLLAVRPEYQNHRLGFRLKVFQRDEVLKQGLSLVRWTFDPLQSRNAWLYIHRLGASVDRYFVHYFGRMGGSANRGLESDRVRVSWAIRSPAVEERLTQPPSASDPPPFDGAESIVETELGDAGLRVPKAVTEPTAARATLEIPFDLALIQEHEPGGVRTWRHAVRDGLRSALDTGYRVDDFAVVRRDHERRSFYFLSRPPPTPATSAGG